MKDLECVNLEVSLKPFKSTEEKDVEKVCQTIFENWFPLTKHAKQIAVMLWISDGSEILEYSGCMNDELEWAKYIGINNVKMWNKKTDPDCKGLHSRSYLYMEHPQTYTYQFIQSLISILKKVGKKVTGKEILVGETFDPGPEFAKSHFKYEWHPEICVGRALGTKCLVCCYSTLHEDQRIYAAYPEGIPEGLPFGTFFGKQSQIFCTDMGFDFLWLSNGFGFGTDGWGTMGATFDGNIFYPEKVDAAQENILKFWKLFREEFHLPVQTRGTNLTTGIDYSTDAVDLEAIYHGGYNILPPPNSPWAALDGDFGLELAGYMSHIAELPSDSYLYRFYIHDPWWMNSPWLDRYEGEAHDIYLPLAISRINQNGKIKSPDHLGLLSIDNSLGEMPESCIYAPTSHLLQCYDTLPDNLSPFIWIYPFHEYIHNGKKNMSKLFFEEWFFIAAINSGLPVSTVISSENFLSLRQKNMEFGKNSIFVLPVPYKESKMNEAIIQFVKNGGKIMLYGSLSNASLEILNLLNLKLEEPIYGNVTIRTNLNQDILTHGEYPTQLIYDGVRSDGGVDTTIQDSNDKETLELATVTTESENRSVMISVKRQDWNGGGVVWCRGYACSRIESNLGTVYPVINWNTEKEQYPLGRLFALSSSEFQYSFRYINNNVNSRFPVIMLHRHAGSCWFSGYTPDTTAELLLNTPLGAPLLLGYETIIKDGYSCYHLPRAWRKECRVFIRQESEHVIVCKELPPVSYRQRHKWEISGLEDASIYVLPKNGEVKTTELLLNSLYPYIIGESLSVDIKDTIYGKSLYVEHVTGTIQMSDIVDNINA